MKGEFAPRLLGSSSQTFKVKVPILILWKVKLTNGKPKLYVQLLTLKY